MEGGKRNTCGEVEYPVSMELALQVINMIECIIGVILIFTGELIIRIRLEH